MTLQQKRAAAIISFAIVGLAAGFLMLTAFALLGSGEALGNRFPGRNFVLAAHNRNDLEIMFKLLPVLLSVGIPIFAQYKLKDWQYWATLAVSILGIAASVYLLMELSDPEQAARFWAYSPVAEVHTFKTFTEGTRPSLIFAGGWFLSVLLIQLGIKHR